MSSDQSNKWLTIGSLIALAFAAFLGIAFDYDQESIWIALSEGLGKVWIILLLLLVIPLVCAYVFNAGITMGRNKELLHAGMHGLKYHIIIIVLALTFVLCFGWLFVEVLFNSTPAAEIELPQQYETAKDRTHAFELGQIIVVLNNVQSTLGTFVLIIMLISGLLGTTGYFWSARSKEVWAERSETFGHQSMKWLGTYFVTLPLAVFLLVLPLFAKGGVSILGIALVYMLAVSVLLILFTFLLYLVVYIGSGTGFSTFAEAIFHVQVSAFTTRSSMATIPVMILAARENFGLSEQNASLLVPVYGTLFRLNKSITNVFEFLFLSYLFSMPIEPGTLAVFIVMQVLVSFVTPGIPGGTEYTNVPILIAAGIPMAGYILVKSVDTIPDIFKTVINVTEVMVVVEMVRKKYANQQ